MWIPVSMFVDLYTFAANKTFILLHEWQCAEISKRRMCPTAYNKSLLLFCLFLMALCERAMHSSVSYSYIYYEIESIPRYPHIRWIIRKNHCFARGKMETQQKKWLHRTNITEMHWISYKLHSISFWNVFHHHRYYVQPSRIQLSVNTFDLKRATNIPIR